MTKRNRIFIASIKSSLYILISYQVNNCCRGDLISTDPFFASLTDTTFVCVYRFLLQLKAVFTTDIDWIRFILKYNYFLLPLPLPLCYLMFFMFAISLNWHSQACVCTNTHAHSLAKIYWYTNKNPIHSYKIRSVIFIWLLAFVFTFYRQSKSDFGLFCCCCCCCRFPNHNLLYGFPSPLIVWTNYWTKQNNSNQVHIGTLTKVSYCVATPLNFFFSNIHDPAHA